jgi:hypothetical protein
MRNGSVSSGGLWPAHRRDSDRLAQGAMPIPMPPLRVEVLGGAVGNRVLGRPVNGHDLPRAAADGAERSLALPALPLVAEGAKPHVWRCVFAEGRLRRCRAPVDVRPQRV